MYENIKKKLGRRFVSTATSTSCKRASSFYNTIGTLISYENKKKMVGRRFISTATRTSCKRASSISGVRNFFFHIVQACKLSFGGQNLPLLYILHTHTTYMCIYIIYVHTCI